MKYSVLIPYYKRYEHFKVTLISFLTLYGDRNDVEIIVIEDYKNYIDDNEHNKLLSLLSEFNQLNIIHLINNINTYNPCLAFNLGVNKSNGKYIILTNPECYHEMNILSGLDSMDLDTNYIVCACKNTREWSFDIIDDRMCVNYSIAEWYQHSTINNRKLHFCSIISKDNYIKIGGFDENYSKGIAYEDDDFRDTVIHNNIPIVCVDDLVCVHLNHDSISTISTAHTLVNLNRDYYINKWRN